MEHNRLKSNACLQPSGSRGMEVATRPDRPEWFEGSRRGDDR